MTAPLHNPVPARANCIDTGENASEKREVSEIMKYRTDLAIENQEMLKSAQPAGYTSARREAGEDITVSEICITGEEGEQAFGKPRGTYVTIEVKGVLEQKDGIIERAAAALAAELKKMIAFDYHLKALVVGLGNEKVTPDSLGPHTVDKVKITSHLFTMFGCDGDWEMANVSGFNPSVTGVTGLETADLIKQVVSLARPDVTIIIDSLAARNMERLSTTIQLCDTGIEPGAGMGNRRKAITRETLGCRVISIGVPTVIDSRTLILEAAESISAWTEQEAESYLAGRDLDMIVTSTDIDAIIRDFSEIIAKAINITLHPGIYS